MLVHTTSLSSFPLLRRGKVRDVYATPESLLLVATDRVSAFDVVMNEPIPDKGAMLTAMSAFWFEKLAHIVPNHLLSTNVKDVDGLLLEEVPVLAGRTMVVKKAKPFPIECVVRGYLAGSGWKEYRSSQAVCGVPLPGGLIESAKLPEPIFTPATKAEEGHDENISFDTAASIVGADVARTLRDLSLQLYQSGSEYAATQGLILADTKFEFGLDEDGQIILIDEALTPDSSRYWLAAEHVPGEPQHNFDKQILRDYLESLDWDKQPPPPSLPANVIAATRNRYRTAMQLLTGLDVDQLETTD